MSTVSAGSESPVDFMVRPEDLDFSSPALVRDFDDRYDSSLEHVDRDRLSKVSQLNYCNITEFYHSTNSVCNIFKAGRHSHTNCKHHPCRLMSMMGNSNL